MAEKPASSVNDAVAKAVQKNFTALRQSVVNASILDKLFEGEVIDQNTYDKATDAAIAQQNIDGIGRQIMLSVRKKLKSDASFFTEFCGLLDGADLKDLSTKLKGIDLNAHGRVVIIMRLHSKYGRGWEALKKLLAQGIKALLNT